jgi:sporulation protein YlmC with PRC-barrel domain
MALAQDPPEKETPPDTGGAIIRDRDADTGDSAGAKSDEVTAEDRQRADELDRQAQQKAEEAKRLAKDAKQMAEDARRLARQAAELRRETWTDEFGPGFLGDHDATTKESETAQSKAEREPLKMNDIVGLTVINHEDKDLGSVDDVVVDLRSGKVRYAAISFGGWLGIGDKLFAVPWEALEVAAKDGERQLVLRRTQDELRKAPGFNQDEWPDYADAEFRDRIGKFYHDDERQQRAFRGDPVAKTEPVKGSELTDITVKNPKGEDLGTIQDMVLDGGSGKIRYAVLSFGGWLGIGDKLFAVPWQAMEVDHAAGDQDTRYLVLDKSKEELKEAPGFPQNDWPDFADASSLQGVDAFYKREGSKQNSVDEQE